MNRRTPNGKRERNLKRGRAIDMYSGNQPPNRKTCPELYGQTLCPRRRFHLSDVHSVRPCDVTHGGPSLCLFF